MVTLLKVRNLAVNITLKQGSRKITPKKKTTSLKSEVESKEKANIKYERVLSQDKMKRDLDPARVKRTLEGHLTNIVSLIVSY